MSTQAGMERTVAERTALARVGRVLARSELAILPGSAPRLVWSVTNADSRRVLVDAGNGAVVRVHRCQQRAAGPQARRDSADNFVYSPSSDSITFGTGRVDDAEDPEVIWHELGHAVQDDQVPGFGSTTQAGSIGEGFGACIMDRDATAYTQDVPHCLRRADTDKRWPKDRTNEVHADGEIWSAALYDVNRAVGRERIDTAILEGQFSLTPGTTFAAAADDIVAAPLELYGPRVASVVQRAFHARGFI